MPYPTNSLAFALRGIDATMLSVKGYCQTLRASAGLRTALDTIINRVV